MWPFHLPQRQISAKSKLTPYVAIFPSDTMAITSAIHSIYVAITPTTVTYHLPENLWHDICL